MEPAPFRRTLLRPARVPSQRAAIRPASPRWTISTMIAAIVAARTTWSHRLTTSVPAPITWAAASAQAIGMKRCALRQRRWPRRRRA